eukprot:403331923
MLLKLTNETKNEQDFWTQEDQKEFQKYLIHKKRQKSQGTTKGQSIVDIYATIDKKGIKNSVIGQQKTDKVYERPLSISKKYVKPKNQIADLKQQLDQLTFESNLKDNKLLKLERELEKIKNQRRNVCTPAAILEQQSHFNQTGLYNGGQSRMNVSYRSVQSFTSSSLVKHTSAIFDSEKLEAKVGKILELIEAAKERNRWEKFDQESYQQIVARLRIQKKFDETKIFSLMPEYKSMVKLGDNTERLKFLANSANLIAQNGIVQCYSKMQERVEHRIKKVEEKNVIFKEEEFSKQRLVEERAMIKKQIFNKTKEIKKLKNIGERLKLSEEEKQEIERRTRKEVQCIKCFEFLITLDSYLKIRANLESNLPTDSIEESFQGFVNQYYYKKREDLLGSTSLNNTMMNISLNQTQHIDNLNNTTTFRVRSAHKSPDRQNTNKTQSLINTNFHSFTLVQKMRQFFRKKIEQELRIKKWKDIRGSEPSFENIIDQYQMCSFRLNSTKQSYDTLQYQVKEKTLLLDQLKLGLERYRKDMKSLKSSNKLQHFLSQDRNYTAETEEMNTVNLLIEKNELPPKSTQIKQEHQYLLKYKLEIDTLQTEILVRLCYRLSQLKVVAKDQIQYDQQSIGVISEYDLISKAFGLDQGLHNDDTIDGNLQTQQVYSPQLTRESDQNSEQIQMMKTMELKKKQFKKKQQAQNPISQTKKIQKVKQQLPKNFNVMSFLKRVLGTKVEEAENHNKKMFAKYKILIGQLKQFLRDNPQEIIFTDDQQAESYSKYQQLINEALKRKQDKEQRKNISMNITLLSQDEDGNNPKPQSNNKPKIDQQQGFINYYGKKQQEDQTPTAEQESKIEIDYLNTTRADKKLILQTRIDMQNQQKRPQTPTMKYGKQNLGYNSEKAAYQKEVKKYRKVMSNLERTEGIFIQKFKKGQDDVYNSITNPGSLRTHKANLFKLFDKNKSNMSQTLMGPSGNAKANTQSHKVLPIDQVANYSSLGKSGIFGSEKFQDINNQVKKHENILFNLYGNSTQKQANRSNSRPKTARQIFKQSHNESQYRDTLILPVGNQLPQKKSIAYKVEFGYDNSNFGQYLDKEGNLTQRSKPSQQFQFPLEMIKMPYGAGIGSRNTKSIFHQNNMTQSNISATPRNLPVNRNRLSSAFNMK